MALDMTTALTIRANVTGMQQVSGLTGGLAKLEKGTNRTATAMQRLKLAAGNAIKGIQRLGIAAGIGVAAVSKMAFDNLQLADSMSKMSQRTGIAVPQLDRFRQAANLSDTSIESMGKGFGILAKNMKDAVEKGTGPANDAFNQLGIKLTDSNGKLRATDQVILDVADKFSKMENGTEKAALASQLFGQRLGGDLIPLLNLGSAEIAKFGTTMTQEGADRAAMFNDRVATLSERFSQMAMAATMELLPAFDAMLGKIEQVAQWFGSLPEPVKKLATGFAAIAIPVVALAVPLGAVAGALAGLAPLVAGIGVAFTAIGPILTAVGTLLAGIFTGPVGWVALLVGAGVALYAFRDQIMGVFTAIRDEFMLAGKWFYETFVTPVLQLGQQIIEFYMKTWQQIFEFVKQPFMMAWQFISENFIRPVVTGFQGAVNAIGSAFSNVFQAIVNPIQAAAKAVFNIIRSIMNAVQQAINAIGRLMGMGGGGGGGGLKAAANGAYWSGGFTPFAKGGMVTGPTLGLVGEAGPEYIVPAHKAKGFAENYLAGIRGAAAIPRFAEGGFVAPANANVNIQTGPVTQMNGQNFVTTQDMSAAVRAGVQQTLDLIRRDGNVRTQLGLA